METVHATQCRIKEQLYFEDTTLKKKPYFIGIDIAKDDFTSSIYSSDSIKLPAPLQVSNNIRGFEQFEAWLIEHKISSSNSIVCLEATGVYGENLCYCLTAKGYQVAVEPPLKVKRSFNTKGHKNDKVDSQKIAEYAFRFADELRIWHPKQDIVEQIRVLLTTREQLVQQKTALTNALRALQIKVVQTPLANEIYSENLTRFNEQIKRIEKEIQKKIDQHPDFRKTVSYLKTIPGIGLLLAANFLVVSDGFKNDMAFQHRKAAAFIGVCPYEHTSGSSVYRRPRTPKYGPARLRKLLNLASRSVVTHKQVFKEYYLQKQLQGKAKSLVLNNVSNKLLKIMCAIIRSQRPYFVNFVSMNLKDVLVNT